MSEITRAQRESVFAPSSAPTTWLPWLTYEVALYGLFFVGGLAIRLAALGLWPLGESEANTALAAWRTLQGARWWPAYYVPLLYDAQLLLFGLFRATDAAARLLPAMAGSVLVLIPYLARDLVGRRGAVVASALLAISPSWVYFSRLADGPILTALASALMLACLYRFAREGRARYLQAALVALALGLTAGPGIYTALLATGLFLLGWAWRRQDHPLVGQLRALAQRLTRRELLLFGGTLALSGSGFLANPGGVGMSFSFLGHWLSALAPSSASPWWLLLQALAGYELLTLALAIAGIVWGVRQRTLLVAFLTTWAALALVAGTVLGHREPRWLPDLLLPAVFLAAQGAEALWARLVSGSSKLDGLIVLLALPFVAFGALELLAYIRNGQESLLQIARVSWGVLIVACVAYGFFGSRLSAARVAAALLGLLMLGGSVRLTTALAWQTGSNAREWLVDRPVSTDLRDLQRLVTGLSSRVAGDPTIMEIEYEASLDPVLGWALHDFPNARPVPVAAEAMALITAERNEEGWPQGYVGQRFRLREGGGAEQPLTGRERLRWLIYREEGGALQATRIQVWIRLPAAR